MNTHRTPNNTLAWLYNALLNSQHNNIAAVWPAACFTSEQPPSWGDETDIELSMSETPRFPPPSQYFLTLALPCWLLVLQVRSTTDILQSGVEVSQVPWLGGGPDPGTATAITHTSHFLFGNNLTAAQEQLISAGYVLILTSLLPFLGSPRPMVLRDFRRFLTALVTPGNPTGAPGSEKELALVGLLA